MRLRSILSEAWRDLTSGTSRALLLAAVLAAVVGTAALADLGAVADIQRREAEFASSGAAVHVLESQDAVDAARCEAIGAAHGVSAAGASRPGQQLTALALPSTRLTVHEVTPGMLDVLGGVAPVADGSTTARQGVWLSSDVAETLDVAPGGRFTSDVGEVDVTGVFTWPDDGRDRVFGFSVLAAVPAEGSFDRCLVSTWPLDEATSTLAFFASDGDADAQPRVGQLNTTLGTSFDADALMSGRPTAWAALAAGITGLVVGYAALRARRLEVAAALHARVPKLQLIWVHILQVAAWSACSAVVLGAVVTWMAQATGLTPWADLWVTGARIVAAGTSTPVLGALLALASTRERHLFTYFKNR